jgi:hypothetical protein
MVVRYAFPRGSVGTRGWLHSSGLTVIRLLAKTESKDKLVPIHKPPSFPRRREPTFLKTSKDLNPRIREDDGFFKNICLWMSTSYAFCVAHHCRALILCVLASWQYKLLEQHCGIG